MNVVPNLTSLANTFGTDKGNTVGHAHGYAQLYSFLFEQFRREQFSMLEIGLLRGGIEAGADVDRIARQAPSVHMWLEFFPRCHCYGFDLSDFSSVAKDRFTFIRGNLSSSEDLDALAARLPPLRLLLDDGSHASFHQQLALLKLFDKVESGGFYVIEDFHWQPPFESELPACQKSADVFENFLTSGELKIDFAPSELTAAIAAQIRNVFVHRNHTGGVNQWTLKMIALQKM
jgi:hypothetical protein